MKLYKFEDKIWWCREVTKIGIFENTPHGKTTVQWIFTYRVVQSGWKTYGSHRGHSHPHPLSPLVFRKRVLLQCPWQPFFLVRSILYHGYDAIILCVVYALYTINRRHRYSVYLLRFLRIFAPWPSKYKQVYIYFITSQTFFPTKFNLRTRVPGGKWVIMRATYRMGLLLVWKIRAMW